MKLTIQGKEYPVAMLGDWTFDEADTVRRLTGLTAGQVLGALMVGDERADRAFATVAYLRAGQDPLELGAMKLNDVDFDPSDDEQAEDGQSPPAAGGGKRSRGRK